MHSGGTDNIVNLWRIASCSSAPWFDEGATVEMFDSSNAPSVLVKKHSNSESSNDSGFIDGIRNSQGGGDDVPKASLLISDENSRLAIDPPDIKVIYKFSFYCV